MFCCKRLGFRFTFALRNREKESRNHMGVAKGAFDTVFEISKRLQSPVPQKSCREILQNKV